MKKLTMVTLIAAGALAANSGFLRAESDEILAETLAGTVAVSEDASDEAGEEILLLTFDGTTVEEDSAVTETITAVGEATTIAPKSGHASGEGGGVATVADAATASVEAVSAAVSAETVTTTGAAGTVLVATNSDDLSVAGTAEIATVSAVAETATVTTTSAAETLLPLAVAGTNSAGTETVVLVETGELTGTISASVESLLGFSEMTISSDSAGTAGAISSTTESATTSVDEVADAANEAGATTSSGTVAGTDLENSSDLVAGTTSAATVASATTRTFFSMASSSAGTALSLSSANSVVTAASAGTLLTTASSISEDSADAGISALADGDSSSTSSSATVTLPGMTVFTNLSTTSTQGNVTYTAPATGSTTGTITGTTQTDISTNPSGSRYLISTTVNVDLSMVSAEQILNYTNANGATGTNSGAIGLQIDASGTAYLTWQNSTGYGSKSLSTATYTFNGKTYVVLTLVGCRTGDTGTILYGESANTLIETEGLRGGTKYEQIQVNTDYVTSLATMPGLASTTQIVVNSAALKLAWLWADETATWTDAGTHWTSPLESTGTRYAFVSGESVEFSGTAGTTNTVTIDSAKTVDVFKVTSGEWIFAGMANVTADYFYIAEGATLEISERGTFLAPTNLVGSGTLSVKGNVSTSPGHGTTIDLANSSDFTGTVVYEGNLGLAGMNLGNATALSVTSSWMWGSGTTTTFNIPVLATGSNRIDTNSTINFNDKLTVDKNSNLNLYITGTANASNLTISNLIVKDGGSLQASTSAVSTKNVLIKNMTIEGSSLTITGTQGQHGSAWQIGSLTGTNVTLTFDDRHSSNNVALLEFGGVSGANTSAFSGELVILQNEKTSATSSTDNGSGDGRHIAIVISGQDILKDTVINFSKQNTTKDNAALVLGVNTTYAKIAGLKSAQDEDDTVSTKVFSGTINYSYNNSIANVLSTSNTANTLEINTAAEMSYTYTGDFDNVNLVKMGTGTQNITGTYSGNTVTVSAGTLSLGVSTIATTLSVAADTEFSATSLSLGANSTTTLSGTTTISGAVTASAGSTFTENSGASFLAASLSVGENSEITLSGTTTISGDVTVGASSTLTANTGSSLTAKNLSLGEKSETTFAAGTYSISGSTTLAAGASLSVSLTAKGSSFDLGKTALSTAEGSIFSVTSTSNRWTIDLSNVDGKIIFNAATGSTPEYTLLTETTVSGEIVVNSGATLQTHGTVGFENISISSDTQTAGTFRIQSNSTGSIYGESAILTAITNEGTLKLAGTIDFNGEIKNSGTVIIDDTTVFLLDDFSPTVDATTGDRTYTLATGTGTVSIYTYDESGTATNTASTLTGTNFVFEGGALSSRKEVSMGEGNKTVIISGTVANLLWAGGATGTWLNEENLDESARSTDWTWKTANDEYFANNDNVTFNTNGAEITVVDGVEAKTLTVEDDVTLIFANDGTTSETTTFKVNGTTETVDGVSTFTGTTIAENKTLTLQSSLTANSYQKITLNATSSTGTIVVDHTSADYNLSLSVGENFAGTLVWQGNFNPNNLTDFAGTSLTLKNSSVENSTASIWADAATSIGYNTTIDATNYSIALGAGTLTFEKDLTIAANSTVSVNSAISVAGTLTIAANSTVSVNSAVSVAGTLYIAAGATLKGDALMLTSSGINGLDFTTASGTGTIELTVQTNSNSSKAVSFASSTDFTGTVVLKGNTFSGTPESTILTDAACIYGDNINGATFGSAAKLAFEGGVAIGNKNDGSNSIDAAIEIRKDASVYFYPNSADAFTVKGTVDVQTGGTIYTRNGTTSFKDMTLNGAFDAAGTTKLTGTVSGSGTLTVTGGTTTITGTIGSDITAKVTGGTVNIQGNDAIGAIKTWTVDGGVLRLGQNAWNASNSTAYATDANITVNSGGTLNLSLDQNSGTYKIFGGTITLNNGAILHKHDGQQKISGEITLGSENTDEVYIRGDWKGGLEIAGTIKGSGTAYFDAQGSGSVGQLFTISGNASNFTGKIVVGGNGVTSSAGYVYVSTMVVTSNLSSASIELAGKHAALQIDSTLTAKAVTFSKGSKMLLTNDLLAATPASLSAADETTLTVITSSAISFAGTALGTGDVTAILADYVEYGTEFRPYTMKTWDYTNGVLTLTLAIPEPSMFGLLAGTLALGLAGTRRRRKSR